MRQFWPVAVGHSAQILKRREPNWRGRKRFVFSPPVFRLSIALLALLPLAASAQNTLRWTTNHYIVTGTNLAQIRQSMEQARPWKDAEYLGRTDWRIDWRYEVESSANGCRCKSFTTQTTILITLPRWTPPAGTDEAVVQSWKKFINALGEHELGHARLALAALAELHKRVKDIASQPDCPGLRQKIDDTARRVIDEHRQRDRDYDVKTNHGATEGVILPGRRGPGRREFGPPR